jgi:hypothetical protein
MRVDQGLYKAVAEPLAKARDRFPSADARQAVELIEGELVAYFKRLHPAFDPECFRRAAWRGPERNVFAHRGEAADDGPV